MTQYLAIDVGGTNLKYGLVDNLGKVSQFQEQASLAWQGGPTLMGQVREVIMLVRKQAKVQGIAISTAGQVDSRRNVITYAGPTIPGYTGMDLNVALSEPSSGLPLTVENDVNCALLSELTGEPGCDLMATIGTGIGGAMALDGHLIRSMNGAMGEFGYVMVNGRSFQDIAATAQLVAHVRRAIDAPTIDGRWLFAHLDVPQVSKIVDQYFAATAEAFASILGVFAADRLIIGGGVAENPVFVPRLATALRPLLPPWLADKLEIRAARNGNRAGMIGAVRFFQTVYGD